jgi:hypothetical protein
MSTCMWVSVCEASAAEATTITKLRGDTRGVSYKGYFCCETVSNAPDLFRTPKLSGTGPS